MATSNKSLTSTWTLAVSSTKTWFLISTSLPALVEIATTAADATAPAAGVIGHVIQAHHGITRALLPAGAIWARKAAGEGGTVIAVDSD